MATVDNRLDRRADALAREGADPFRLDLLARAQRFKRSWVEMAEALVKLRVSCAYEQWGYSDIYSYCADELRLKKRTVDKLTGSYSTIERHAPQILREERDSGLVPTVDAVDYFRRAIDKDVPSAKLEELREAVFEECKPVSEVRRQFHSELFAKSDEENRLQLLRRTSASVRRLVDVLPNIEGLRQDRVAAVAAALTALQQDLDTLIPKAQQRVA